MIHQNTKKISLFTKDLELIKKVRQYIYSLKITISFNLNQIHDKDSLLPNIIIIDQRFFEENNIKNLRIGTKIIYLTNNTSPENIKSILEFGADNILFCPINYNLLFCLIKKYLGILQIHRYEKLKCRGITLCKDSSSVTYNECKIFLTDREYSVIKSIMTNNKDYKISKQCLQVTVCRINKKSKNGVGLKLIKNKRGKGYYISI